MEYYLITFGSTHHYMRAEKFLEDLDYNFELFNIPPEISADCGLGLKFQSVVDYDKVLTIIKRDGIEIEGLYLIKKEANQKNIVQLR